MHGQALRSSGQWVPADLDARDADARSDGSSMASVRLNSTAVMRLLAATVRQISRNRDQGTHKGRMTSKIVHHGRFDGVGCYHNRGMRCSWIFCCSSASEPSLVMTTSARAILRSNDHWALIKAAASASAALSRVINRRSCTSGDAATTITGAHRMRSSMPDSNSRGASMTTLLPHNHWCHATSRNISQKIAGCVTPLTYRLAAGSDEMILRSCLRSRLPDASRMPGPNRLRRSVSVRDPRSTARRASTSRSTMINPHDCNARETVDFPVAMPPVKPMHLPRWNSRNVTIDNAAADAERACTHSPRLASSAAVDTTPTALADRFLRCQYRNPAVAAVDADDISKRAPLLECLMPTTSLSAASTNRETADKRVSAWKSIFGVRTKTGMGVVLATERVNLVDRSFWR